VFIADSLAMGEAAVQMASSGEVDSIICMGVDFMAESVRSTLDSNNFQVRSHVSRLNRARADRKGGGRGGRWRGAVWTGRTLKGLQGSLFFIPGKVSLNLFLFLVFMVFQKIPVYRLSERKIGCSLAESAEREAYAAFLHQVGGCCHQCILDMMRSYIYEGLVVEDGWGRRIGFSVEKALISC
jgi:hypothetical protein